MSAGYRSPSYSNTDWFFGVLQSVLNFVFNSWFYVLRPLLQSWYPSSLSYVSLDPCLTIISSLLKEVWKHMMSLISRSPKSGQHLLSEVRQIQLKNNVTLAIASEKWQELLTYETRLFWELTSGMSYFQWYVLTDYFYYILVGFSTLIQQNTANYLIMESILNEFATVSKLSATRLTDTQDGILYSNVISCSNTVRIHHSAAPVPQCAKFIVYAKLHNIVVVL